MKKLLSIAILFALVFSFSSCDNDDSSDANYEIPTTYDFDNVSYTGQTDRLDMLGELTTYLKTANTSGVVLDADAMLNMYANENTPFADAALNASTKQLKSKTFETDQAVFEARINAIAQASTATVTGENGTAGVVTTDSRSVLLDAQGKELTQLIEKGLMGACFFYQISEVYLSEDKIGETVDNETVVDGEGTDMEHHWDEAFGYFGVATDFPSNTADIRYWGQYTNGRDEYLNCNETIMNAYIAGRAAISNNDTDAKWENADIIRAEIEKVAAATAIHYLNSAITNYIDMAEKAHVLSEAQAFFEALKYNANRTISATDFSTIQTTFDTSFYTMSVAEIITIKDMLSDTYGFNDFKDNL